jgi:hypothetical protein
MHMRLNSILTAIEEALVAADPSPSDGSWHAVRTVNYTTGIARMKISVRDASGELKPRGAIHLNGFRLADESACLKATLTWHGSEASTTRSVFEKPYIDWLHEAQQISTEWVGRPPAAPEAKSDTTDDAADVRAVAAG